MYTLSMVEGYIAGRAGVNIFSSNPESEQAEHRATKGRELNKKRKNIMNRVMCPNFGYPALTSSL